MGVIKIFTRDTNSNQYTDINNYQKIKEDIKKQDKIMHFPETIPIEATNAELYGFSRMPYGGEALMLSFYIDSDYIDNEFKKYEFINKNENNMDYWNNEVSHEVAQDVLKNLALQQINYLMKL